MFIGVKLNTKDMNINKTTYNTREIDTKKRKKKHVLQVITPQNTRKNTQTYNENHLP